MRSTLPSTDLGRSITFPGVGSSSMARGGSFQPRNAVKRWRIPGVPSSRRSWSRSPQRQAQTQTVQNPVGDRHTDRLSEWRNGWCSRGVGLEEKGLLGLVSCLRPGMVHQVRKEAAVGGEEPAGVERWSTFQRVLEGRMAL